MGKSFGGIKIGSFTRLIDPETKESYISFDVVSKKAYGNRILLVTNGREIYTKREDTWSRWKQSSWHVDADDYNDWSIQEIIDNVKKYHPESKLDEKLEELRDKMKPMAIIKFEHWSGKVKEFYWVMEMTYVAHGCTGGGGDGLCTIRVFPPWSIHSLEQKPDRDRFANFVRNEVRSHNYCSSVDIGELDLHPVGYNEHWKYQEPEHQL